MDHFQSRSCTDFFNSYSIVGYFYITWLAIVTISFLYNAWVIPLRTFFPFQSPENTKDWMIVDYIADFVYLIDVLFIKHRTKYLHEGFWVKDIRLTQKNYMRKLQFKLDVLSLLPLDLLYLKFGTQAVYWRAPRLLKIQTFWEFFKLLDRVVSSPHLLRIVKTVTYMLYMIHITACTYYAYSVYEGRFFEFYIILNMTSISFISRHRLKSLGVQWQRASICPLFRICNKNGDIYWKKSEAR